METYNYKKIFEIFKNLSSEIEFCKISEIDEFVENKKKAIFLKHDIHGVNLENLLKLSEHEIKLSIRGTYYFMPLNDPLTKKFYSVRQQISTMLELQKMGHEIGLHFNPEFQLTKKNKDFILSDYFKLCLDEFRSEGLIVNSFNLHGDTHLKRKDKNNYNIAFEFFSEIARHQDFPEYKNINEADKKVILQNRFSINNYNINFCGDYPVWSRQNKFITTNFFSDNLLSKKKTIKLLIRKETYNSFLLSSNQPPGSKNLSKEKKIIKTDISNQDENYQDIIENHDFEFGKDNKKIYQLLRSCGSFTMLIHPQFYL